MYNNTKNFDKLLKFIRKSCTRFFRIFGIVQNWFSRLLILQLSQLKFI
jgi:hypothetical protein